MPTACITMSVVVGDSVESLLPVTAFASEETLCSSVVIAEIYLSQVCETKHRNATENNLSDNNLNMLQSLLNFLTTLLSRIASSFELTLPLSHM